MKDNTIVAVKQIFTWTKQYKTKKKHYKLNYISTVDTVDQAHPDQIFSKFNVPLTYTHILGYLFIVYQLLGACGNGNRFHSKRNNNCARITYNSEQIQYFNWYTCCRFLCSKMMIIYSTEIAEKVLPSEIKEKNDRKKKERPIVSGNLFGYRMECVSRNFSYEFDSHALAFGIIFFSEPIFW